MERVLRVAELERLHDSARATGQFLRGLLEALQIAIDIAPPDLSKIPATGPLIAVANHPHGLLDGVLLASVLCGVRGDVRILANGMLSAFPELARICFFIDPFDRPDKRAANGRGLRQAIRHVRAGGALIVFPAGEVSHFDIRRAAVRDPEWRLSAAGLLRVTGAKALPCFVRGSNSFSFQMLGMLHPALRTAALPSEFLNKRGKTTEVRIGSAIASAQLQATGDDEAVTRYLRLRTEWLAHRENAAVEERPRTMEPVSSAVEPRLLQTEVDRLEPLQQMGDLAVYMAEADRIPSILPEIGRLRELTFREAGEGSGNSRDLDSFDLRYRHLFVWNRERREIAGAYRVGDVPRLLAAFGPNGLYTNSLFRFSRGFLAGMGPTLELGRSFVISRYQRQFAPLLLLWRGIGAWVAAHPQYATLIGAVSVSSRYAPASRELIVRYFGSRAEAAAEVRPRRPLRPNLLREWELRALSSLTPNPDELSSPIADLEPDGKGLPVLMRQYLRLGGQMLAFSVDPGFGHTLDAFVKVDLRHTCPEMRARYLGPEGSRRFEAWHGRIRDAA